MAAASARRRGGGIVRLESRCSRAWSRRRWARSAGGGSRRRSWVTRTVSHRAKMPSRRGPATGLGKQAQQRGSRGIPAAHASAARNASITCRGGDLLHAAVMTQGTLLGPVRAAGAAPEGELHHLRPLRLVRKESELAHRRAEERDHGGPDSRRHVHDPGIARDQGRRTLDHRAGLLQAQETGHAGRSRADVRAAIHCGQLRVGRPPDHDDPGPRLPELPRPARSRRARAIAWWRARLRGRAPPEPARRSGRVSARRASTSSSTPGARKNSGGASSGQTSRLAAVSK